MYKNFNVIVVGGGHAGTEAALASARLGCNTLLITQNIDMIGQMSCNPAIGGIGKGHLVKEIDAMGGAMAEAIDRSGIQFRKLNTSKGAAVRSTRAQADKILYKQAIRQILENQKNLFIIQQLIIDIILEENKIIGVVCYDMVKFYSNTVIITTGTFLNGMICIGNNSYAGGRIGESSSILLSKKLKELKFKVNRLKTGTSPRIDIRSIDFRTLVRQDSDCPLPVFSFFNNSDIHPKQVPCYITYTNKRTHEIVKDNIRFSSSYSGMIKGVGPRYCPSIEDKIMRYPTNNSHQIFLEPEGLTSNEIYLNGISTSLPFSIQIELIHSIEGLYNAHITRPGYAIEYDFLDPIDLSLTLESKIIKGLFLAGQINGTTGYEEAAAQGLLAGINAAKLSNGEELWFPFRNQAYIGVLIDDLCTHGVQEPYRMFTSRAEYRLSLREDNADLRLTEIARKLGLIDDVKWNFFCLKQEKIEKEYNRIKNIWINLNDNKNIVCLNKLIKYPLTRSVNGEQLLRRPELNYKKLTSISLFSPALLENQVAEELEIRIKYKGYIDLQTKEVNYQIQNEKLLLPEEINYNLIPGLSNEVVKQLVKYKPYSIGQASRISGVTPAAISVLLIWLKKQSLLCIK